jgi:DNA-binding LacI/PurR family transcriptional regulator/signal transduction histidine kinase
MKIDGNRKTVEHRPTIGLVIDWIENHYQVNLLNGIESAAKKRDANLITFVGGAYKSPRIHEVSRNMIYNFIDKNNVDGLIITQGTVGHYCTQMESYEFFMRFQPLPVVSINQDIHQFHSISVDAGIGLRKVLVHLIEEHHYKKIAFIQGPPTSPEAVERFNIYLDTLEKYGIPIKNALITVGDFTPQAGMEAVKTLLREQGGSFDAIAASNDDMAFGAMLALQERKICVPTEMAVTGFDDLELCTYINPPLTTVKAPIFEIGGKAVDTLLALIRGEDVQKIVHMPSDMVVRESCGCLHPSRAQDSVPECKRIFRTTKPWGNAKNDPDDFINELKKHFPDMNDDECTLVKELIESVKTSIEQKKQDIYFFALNSFLFKARGAGANEEKWQLLISIIREYMIAAGGAKSDYFDIEDLLHISRMRISEYVNRNKEYLDMVNERSLQKFRDISEELVSKLDMEDIISLLAEHLPSMNIRGCYFSLFEGEGAIDPQSSTSRLILAFNEKGRIDLKNTDVRFPSILLFPRNILPAMSRYSLICEPLFFGKNNLGIALFDLDVNIGFSYSIMRRVFLNSALKGAVFVQQLQNQAVNLETANLELKNTLERLRTTQKRLVESEKMAALGDLVAGIAHEINTPIGIGVTAASHLEEFTKELETMYHDDRLKKTDLEKFIMNTTESTKMILYNLQRAYELIRSFKQIAVDQSSEEKRKFKIRDYLSEIILTLRPQLKKTNHAIEINCPQDLTIESYPGAFSQIVTNLVLNSLVHGFESVNDGTIILAVDLNDGELLFTYSDNGKGIDEKDFEKIFTPFYTTKRGQGGTGLGLNLVYNIVTQRLKGTITFTSQTGKGTSFFITIPIN